MGAGARFAAERDRWPEHWRVADLDVEADGLLALLHPSEELRAVVPAMRSTPSDGVEQVLIGVTDRRVVIIARHRTGTESLRVIDVTHCAPMAPRDGRLVPHDDGHVQFDLDEDSIARMWAHVDAVGLV
jgi:hypothetical protein